MRAAVYLRVSSARQAGDDRASLPVQIEQCTKYAADRGWQVVATAEDHESGKNVSRDGYQQLLDLARRREIDQIIVYSASRLGRKASERLARRDELDELGVKVHSTTEDLRDWLSDAINAVMAENELRVMRARVAPALQRKAQDGHWLRNPPWGLAKDPHRKGNLVKGVHFDLVLEIYRLCAAGTPLRQIAATVNHVLVRRAAEGIVQEHQPARKNATITFATVRNILLDPAYEGKVVWNDVDAPGLWGRLIDEDLVAKARAALHRRALQRARVSPSFPYWIHGLAFCPHCGRQMIPKVTVKRKTYAYMLCTKFDPETLKRACPQPHVPIEPLQDWLVEQLQAFKVETARALSRLEAFEAHRVADLQAERLNHEREIERLEARLERAEIGYVDGVLTGPRVKEIRDGVNEVLPYHRSQLVAIDAEVASSDDYESLRRLLEGTGWLETRHTNPAAFRDFLKRFIARVLVHGKGDYEIVWVKALARTVVEA